MDGEETSSGRNAPGAEQPAAPAPPSPALPAVRSLPPAAAEGVSLPEAPAAGRFRGESWLREEIAERFQERVAAFRWEYFIFSSGAFVLSLAVAFGVGFLFYAFLTSVTFPWLGRRLIPFWPFMAIYAALFLACGYTLYRRRPSAALKSGWEGALEGDSTWPWLVAGGLADLTLMGFIFSFPALVFHFLEEVLTGRHLFVSPEVRELALEILLEGGEKVSPEFLQARLGQRPRELRLALKLLLEMKLLLLLRAGGRRVLVQSDTAREILGE